MFLYAGIKYIKLPTKFHHSQVSAIISKASTRDTILVRTQTYTLVFMAYSPKYYFLGAETKNFITKASLLNIVVPYQKCCRTTRFRVLLLEKKIGPHFWGEGGICQKMGKSKGHFSFDSSTKFHHSQVSTIISKGCTRDTILVRTHTYTLVFRLGIESHIILMLADSRLDRFTARCTM